MNDAEELAFKRHKKETPIQKLRRVAKEIANAEGIHAMLRRMGGKVCET